MQLYEQCLVVGWVSLCESSNARNIQLYLTRPHKNTNQRFSISIVWRPYCFHLFKHTWGWCFLCLWTFLTSSSCSLYTSSPRPGQPVQLWPRHGVRLGDIHTAGSAVYWQWRSTSGENKNTVAHLLVFIQIVSVIVLVPLVHDMTSWHHLIRNCLLIYLSLIGHVYNHIGCRNTLRNSKIFF